MLSLQPNVFTTGADDFHFNNLEFVTVGGNVKTLTSAYNRYSHIMFTHHSSSDDSKNKFIVEVSVSDHSEAYPQLETDESYSLDISKNSDISLSAKTIYGAIRGLETLSQLVIYDFEDSNYFIPATPIHIDDSPRYPHRGLLLDTSRHYQPMPFIKSTIDSLAYAKYNVFHWHVVDTQSFPFESKTSPGLWKGSFTSAEKYSQEDIKEVVEYGRERGVKVMIEFDMPGHAASWCTGYPDICPSTTCLQPLNPASNLTFPLITSLLGECTGANNDGKAALFPYSLLHLGGDEVNYACWESSSQIQQWQIDNGLANSEETYKYFVDKAATITRQQSRTPVQWVEVSETHKISFFSFVTYCYPLFVLGL
jgi:hexosaminidase